MMQTIARHQWTHDGDEVLILKCVPRDGCTYGGFRWPLTVGAEVSAPDWTPASECGGGLHGWPWGFSVGDGKKPEWSETWLVFGAEPADVVDLGGKVKARRGTMRYVGDWMGATAFVLAGQMAWVHHAASGAASATGWRGAASATGESGAASATGAMGAASATGAASAAVVTGLNGRAQAGPHGVIVLAYFDRKLKTVVLKGAHIGGKYKPHTWYRLNDAGEFVEC